MSEEKYTKTEEVKEQLETPKDRIALAKEASDKLEAQNKRMEENIAKLEGLRAESILSGATNAGQSQQNLTEDPAKKMADEIVNAFK